MKTNYKNLLNDITAFVFDVDGVFTDGSVQISTKGELLRTMIVRDGYAVKQAINADFKVCVITGGKNEGVKLRLQGLGVEEIHLGVQDKVGVLKRFLEDQKLQPNQVAYMGDDLPDLESMQLVGFRSCPQDAVPEIKAICTYISHRDGGKGCVRDLVEQVMRAQDKWPGQKSS